MIRFYEVVEFVVLIFLLVALLSGVYLISKESCEKRGASFDGVKFEFIGGCMVEVDDRFIPIDNVRFDN